MIQNLALLSQEEKDKVKVDLAAAGVAFKERYNIYVCSKTIEDEQPPLLRQWFRQRLIYYRKISNNLPNLV